MSKHFSRQGKRAPTVQLSDGERSGLDSHVGRGGFAQWARQAFASQLRQEGGDSTLADSLEKDDAEL